jgi:transcription termination factor NusB
MKHIDLYDIELARLTNLDTIASTFVEREKKESLAVQTQTFKDYVSASSENIEDFQETVDRIISGVRPHISPSHFSNCEQSGIQECICLIKPGDTVPSQIL